MQWVDFEREIERLDRELAESNRRNQTLEEQISDLRREIDNKGSDIDRLRTDMDTRCNKLEYDIQDARRATY